MATYYRVVNLCEEPLGSVQSSDRRSPFRQMAIAMLPLCNCVCNFANSADLSIQKACEVAINIPAYIDDINEWQNAGMEQIDLSLIMVNNPSGPIRFDIFFNFACDYVDKINETGLSFEFNNTNTIWEYIWEFVRANEYPCCPSRLESVFLFNTLSEAEKYNFETWNNDTLMRTVEVETANNNVAHYDMSWFTDVPPQATYQEAKSYARNYWAAKDSSHPVKELLYQGDYIVKQ